MNNLPQVPGMRLFVKRLLICEVLPQHNQYFRPYQTVMGVDSMSKLQERIDATQGGSIKASMFSGISNGILTPSTTTTGIANIVNGWGEKRFRFLLEVVFQGPLGTTTEVILGYTDYMGATTAGFGSNTRVALDHRMTFFINSVVKVRAVEVNMPGHTGTQISVTAGNHVLSNLPYADGGYRYNLSPENVMNNLVTSTYAMPGSVEVASNSLTTHPVASKRISSSPTNYLATMFGAVSQVSKEHELQTTVPSYHDIYQQARQKIGFTSVTEDYFTKALLNVTQSIEPTFTFGDLVKMDPSIEGSRHDAIHVNFLKEAVRAFDNPLNTEHLGGASGETIAANIIAGSLPGIMLDCATTFYHFTATNKTLNGQFIYTFGSIDSFGNMDLTPYIETLNGRITTEILNDVSFNGTIPMTVEVRCDVMGETFINIQMGNNHAVPFVVPSFADALWTPIVTTNRDDITKLSEDMNHMLTMVTDTQSNIVYNEASGVLNTW